MPDRLARLERALELLDAAAREPVTVDDDDPVFIASIGWRSGSTMLQRALMTDPSLLVWGEPMAHLMFLDRLLEPLLDIDESWPTPSHWISHRRGLDLTQEWVATLSPDAGHLKAAYRSFFDTWLATPARGRGFKRWGVKQVRWSGLHGTALRWLYPKCRLVAIARHPVSAYLSMRNSGFDPPAWGYLLRSPDQWIATLEDHANHWNKLATSWSAISEKLDVTWLRYEDIVDGRVDLDAVGGALGLKLKAEVARATKVGGSNYSIGMSAQERDRINELTEPGRNLLSYFE
jgi:hypothetical protein